MAFMNSSSERMSSPSQTVSSSVPVSAVDPDQAAARTSRRRSATGARQTTGKGKALADWCQQQGNWELEVVKRTPGVRGFSVQPRRWVVERSFSWLSRNRRLSKDYERKVQTSETLVQIAMIRLIVARLGKA